MTRFKIFLGGSTLALGLAAACGFPDVTFADFPLDDTNDGSLEAGTDATTDTGVDAGTVDDAGEVLIDGSSPDALIVQDAGHAIDASGCTTCDCDGDGFNDLDKAGCEDAGGPNDCDDSDMRVKPTQGYLLEAAVAPHFGDWNCDGKTEKLWAENMDCAQLALLGLGCNGKFGFTGAVACGQTATWVQCGSSLLSCVALQTKQEIQACR